MRGLPLLILAAAITTMGISFLYRSRRVSAASNQYANAGRLVTSCGAVMMLISIVAITTGR